jgi:cardiolipin synthase (CMP-forming)
VRVFDIGAKDGPEQVTDRVLTIPNALSVLRLLALPVIYMDLVAGRVVRAFVVLAVFAATDWFDGYVARRFDQVSELGKLLDPLSDRIFIVVVGAAVVVAGIVPLWAILLVVARDVLVLVAGLVLLRGGVRPPAVTRTGKAATFGLLWALPMFLLAEIVPAGARPGVRAAAWFTLLTNTGLYYLAAGQYAVAVLRQRRVDTPEGDQPDTAGSEVPTRDVG